MVDLETLSTKNNAIILTIGAIKFNREISIGTFDDIKVENKFYKRINIESCEKIGLCRDKNTEDWWLKQDEKVKYEAFQGMRENIEDVLREFNIWFGDSKYIWSLGICFDICILNEVYERLGINIPWKFWNVRDCRTILDCVGIKPSKNPYKHNSLMDSYYQIVDLQRCFVD